MGKGGSLLLQFFSIFKKIQIAMMDGITIAEI